ncbi:MAG: hypothetical protein WAW79_07100, partial [Steroidobacteraceae bacterium]
MDRTRESDLLVASGYPQLAHFDSGTGSAVRPYENARVPSTLVHEAASRRFHRRRNSLQSGAMRTILTDAEVNAALPHLDKTADLLDQLIDLT